MSGGEFDFQFSTVVTLGNLKKNVSKIKNWEGNTNQKPREITAIGNPPFGNSKLFVCPTAISLTPKERKKKVTVGNTTHKFAKQPTWHYVFTRILDHYVAKHIRIGAAPMLRKHKATTRSKIGFQENSRLLCVLACSPGSSTQSEVSIPRSM